MPKKLRFSPKKPSEGCFGEIQKLLLLEAELKAAKGNHRVVTLRQMRQLEANIAMTGTAVRTASQADGEAERCYHTNALHLRCGNEGHACCPACGAGLCVDNCGLLAGNNLPSTAQHSSCCVHGGQGVCACIWHKRVRLAD